MRHTHEHAVLFSMHSDDEQQLRLLCSKAITILSSLWGDRWTRINAYRRPWIDGGFNSPVGAGDIATATGYKLSGTAGRIEVISQEVTDQQEKIRPDIVAICGKRKWPAFIYFDEVGYDDARLFGEGMALAVELVNVGYHGAIRCYSDCIDNNKYENHERCVIAIGKDGLSVRVHWGDEVFVGPLLDFCRAEGFVEEDGWMEWERKYKTA